MSFILLLYMYVYEVNGKINEWMNDMNESVNICGETIFWKAGKIQCLMVLIITYKYHILTCYRLS